MPFRIWTSTAMLALYSPDTLPESTLRAAANLILRGECWQTYDAVMMHLRRAYGVVLDDVTTPSMVAALLVTTAKRSENWGMPVHSLECGMLSGCVRNPWALARLLLNVDRPLYALTRKDQLVRIAEHAGFRVLYTKDETMRIMRRDARGSRD